METTLMIQTQEISEEDKNEILGSYEPIKDWKEIGPFCVDGRFGVVAFVGQKSQEQLYVQALGGSLSIAAVSFLENPEGRFIDTVTSTNKSLKEQGFGVSVHRGSHAHGEASDCGFADNFQAILERLNTHGDEIKEILKQAAPAFMSESINEIWDQIVALAGQAANPDKHVSGEEIIKSVETSGANVQTLKDEHGEIAAVVNLKEETTLNTENLVENGWQAFNLDLWYVLKQADTLSLDNTFTSLATLGLYVATEMVLVEDKKGVRLPILINS